MCDDFREKTAVGDRFTNTQTDRPVCDDFREKTAVGDRLTNTHMDSIGVSTMEAAVIPIELGVDLPAIRYFE